MRRSSGCGVARRPLDAQVIIRITVGLAALGLGVAAAGSDLPMGAATFSARCAVCHGPQADGIPGSFPSLHEQIVAFAKTPPGRDYLIMVVTTGLLGDLNVGGVAYRGAMPAQSGLTETEIADVLTYLATDRGKDVTASAITSAEVLEARARHPEPSAQNTRSLRPVLPEP